jgi:Fic family protein
VRAAILSHRFLSIHPFADGNGRTGRLLATAELWRSSYRMRGFLSFEEHFAREQEAYYDALQMGLPVNFYDGRHDADLSRWLEFFVGIVDQASAALRERAAELQKAVAPSAPPWEGLSRRQQQVLTRLALPDVGGSAPRPDIRPGDLQEWFGVSGNTAREWLRQWKGDGFVVDRVSGRGLRIRRYQLADRWRRLIRRGAESPND